jgi:hypothetical protein
MPSTSDFRSPALIAALTAFLALAASVRGLGVVGEVAAPWALARPPAVLVQADPPVWADPSRDPHAGGTIGPFVASQVRPIEQVAAGPISAPLMVNQYTGGLPDWPSRALYALSGSLAAVTGLHVIYGALILAFGWRVLRVHGAIVGAGAAAMWLATDWSFVFYRKVLGGTEAWLLLGTLLLAHGLWDRRWRGGSIAPWALALGLGLGLHAKITFVAVVAAAAIAALLTRWDRGPLHAPAPAKGRTVALAGAVVLGFLAPALVALAHQASLPAEPHLRSHDFVGLQLDRLWAGLADLGAGDRTPNREQPANLLSFLAQPLGFYARACGAQPLPIAAGRVAGWIVLVAGTLLAWRDRGDGQAGALLRWLSLATPLAALLLFALNRDLHHLAMLTAWIAMWGGLAVDRVAALVSPPRSPARARTCLLLLLPWMASGASAAWNTGEVLDTCTTPTVLERGQDAIVEMLRSEDADRVLVVDYDLYGALDVLAPEIDFVHGWGAMSASDDRRGTMADLLRTEPSWWLVVRPSAPTIYSYSPSEIDRTRIAEAAGVSLTEVAALKDATGPYATLYRVSKR